MFAAIGLIVLFAMVFGGFAITGGHLGPVFHAIPHEMLIIGGAAAGALLLGNSMGLLKQVGGGVGKVFKGPTYFKQDYLDTIFLTAKLMKMLRKIGRAPSELQSLMRISYAVFCLQKQTPPPPPPPP